MSKRHTIRTTLLAFKCRGFRVEVGRDDAQLYVVRVHGQGRRVHHTAEGALEFTMWLFAL